MGLQHRACGTARLLPARRLQVTTIRRVRHVALAGSVVLGLAGRAEAQIELDELELTIRPTTSAPLSSGVAVRNVSDEPQTVRISLADWARLEDGTNVEAEHGRGEGSCAPALEVFPRTMQLGPGESQTVRVTYAGGPRVAACWALVFAETTPRPSAGGGVQLLVSMKVGLKVYVEPADAIPQAELQSVDVGPHRPHPTDPVRDTTRTDVVVAVRNTGKGQIKLNGRVEIRTVDNAVVARVPFVEAPVLPGARRVLRALVPVLRPGQYVAVALMDYGGAELLAGQVELEVVP